MREQAADFVDTALANAPSGGVIQAAGGKPAKPTRRVHPMAVGLRKAKEAIAAVLDRSANLEALQLALQSEFDHDPTKFLRVYEPLLRRYEELEKGEADTKQTIRVLGPALIIAGGQSGGVPQDGTPGDDALPVESEEV